MEIADKIQLRRQKQKDELRQKIMDAARQLFAKQGVEQVSMRKIAEAISYSPTAIYLHFEDKESLMREICREDFGRLASEFNRIGKIDDPIEQVRAIGRAYIRFGTKNPNHYRLMFMTQHAVEPEAKDLAQMNDPTHDGYAFLRMCVTRVIEAGLLKPEFSDAELVSQTLWATVHGVTSLQITHAGCPWVKLKPLAHRIEAVVVSTLDGMLLRSKGGHKR
jgi:AcrR family transcriptional regulator